MANVTVFFFCDRINFPCIWQVFVGGLLSFFVCFLLLSTVGLLRALVGWLVLAITLEVLGSYVVF